RASDAARRPARRGRDARGGRPVRRRGPGARRVRDAGGGGDPVWPGRTRAPRPRPGRRDPARGGAARRGRAAAVGDGAGCPPAAAPAGPGRRRVRGHLGAAPGRRLVTARLAAALDAAVRWMTDAPHATRGVALTRILLGAGTGAYVAVNLPDRHALWGAGARWAEPVGGFALTSGPALTAGAWRCSSSRPWSPSAGTRGGRCRSCSSAGPG